jgi:Flp pilus assembly protein TadG
MCAMLRIDRYLSLRLKALLRDTSANFGMMAALVTVPVMISVGCAIDVSYAVGVKTQMQAAADDAAVGSLAEQSVGVISALTNGTSGEVTLAETDANNLFTANMDAKVKAYVKSTTISVTKDSTSFKSKIKFSADVPTSFLAIIGIKSITVAGVAEGAYLPATYIDFYMMLDNTPSMGLGATTADISKLEANTSDKCGFACHDLSGKSDYYTLAKKLGVQTRIELVRSAAQQLTQTAQNSRLYSDQYRMAVYTMGSSAETAKLTKVADMSSNMSTVSSNTAAVDLMTIPYQNYNGDEQTDFNTAFSSLTTEIGTGGEGTNSSDRQKVLFFVSDGVADYANASSCTKTTTGGRCQEPFVSSLCDKIKKNGVRIAVLYTTYQPVPNNSWYNKYIDPFHSEIPNDMKACASDGLYFEVSPSDGISEAMTALFQKVINIPRLTN